MNNPLVASVVIPSYNRPRAIETCLDCLAGQDLPAGSYEVIVVDDGSEPPLSLDPARWAARFPLKLVRQANSGPAGARNRGVAEAQGELLAFTDDDCLPTPTWLPTFVAALQQSPEAMIGGSTFNGLKQDLFAETSQLILELVYEHFNAQPGNAYFFASNNIAMRRDRYLASGGFDRDFNSPAAEDREFCDRWRMQERPLTWERQAVIEHRHHQSWRRFLRLHYRYGYGAYLYQAKRKQRGSGTMAEDLGFHRSLTGAVFRKLSGRGWWVGLRLLTYLIAWQVANTVGFLAAWVSRRK